MKSLKIAYEKKTKEIQHLKDLTSHLKLKLRDANCKEKDNLLTPQKYKQFVETSLDPGIEGSGKRAEFAERYLISQFQSRKKGQSVELSESVGMNLLGKD